MEHEAYTQKSRVLSQPYPEESTLTLKLSPPTYEKQLAVVSALHSLEIGIRVEACVHACALWTVSTLCVINVCLHPD